MDDDTAREKAVERTLGVSLGRLNDAERQSFRELAVFPEDVDVPLGVFELFWGLPERETRNLCKRLHGLSLLLRFERAAKTFCLPDVVRQYLIYEQDDLRGFTGCGSRPTCCRGIGTSSWASSSRVSYWDDWVRLARRAGVCCNKRRIERRCGINGHFGSSPRRRRTLNTRCG